LEDAIDQSLEAAAGSVGLPPIIDMNTQFTPGPSLLGGVLIGASAALLLRGIGRIAGITGIVGGTLHARAGDLAWRLWFLLGLVGGGALLARIRPSAFGGQLDRPGAWLVGAGLLVGFGTRMGNGCTSGHGVCGIGRLSKRSMVATLVFIFTGALTVLGIRLLRGGGS
jgi:uncharacterized membrane protein YedE/YeeE